MMHGESSRKVPDGKLVNVEVDYDDRFRNVDIRGDFFIEPPNALEVIEGRLEGLPVDTPRQEIISEMRFVDADLIGFSFEDVADVLLEACGRGDEI